MGTLNDKEKCFHALILHSLTAAGGALRLLAAEVGIGRCRVGGVPTEVATWARAHNIGCALLRLQRQRRDKWPAGGRTQACVWNKVETLAICLLTAAHCATADVLTEKLTIIASVAIWASTRGGTLCANC